MSVFAAKRPPGVPLPRIQHHAMRPKRAQNTLTTTHATQVSAPATGAIVVDKIFLTEYSNAAQTVDIRVVKSGDTAGDGNLVFQDVPLAAKETVVIEGPIALVDGDILTALASAASSVNMLTVYREEVPA